MEGARLMASPVHARGGAGAFHTSHSPRPDSREGLAEFYQGSSRTIKRHAYREIERRGGYLAYLACDCGSSWPMTIEGRARARYHCITNNGEAPRGPQTWARIKKNLALKKRGKAGADMS